MINPLYRRRFLRSAIMGLGVFPLYGQFLLVDRALKNPATSSLSIGPDAKQGAGFAADHFQVGEAGDVWVLDRLRMWGETGSRVSIGDRFEKLMLFGGLEAKPLAPGEVDCDCHNHVAIQTATLQRGSDSDAGPNLRISRLGPSIWQLDFEQLNWSVPGGVEIQFGVAGLSRSNPGATAAWSAYTVRTAASHQISLFDGHGKLLGPHPAATDPALGFAVQVWGHLPATIEIRPRGGFWDVTLNSAGSLHAAHVERSSFHFGPNSAKPVSVHSKGDDLVMTFRAADTGIRPGDLNACLTGRRQDGVPFEGCDLVKRAR